MNKFVTAITAIVLVVAASALGCMDFGPFGAPASAPLVQTEPEHDPCAYLDEPFDVVVTAATDEWSQRYDMQLSGEDKFLRQEVRKVPSNDMWYQEENIYKDRVKYVRHSTPDDPDTLGDWWIAGTGFSGGPTLPCLDRPQQQSGARGASGGSGSDEPAYTSHESISDEEGSAKEEIWVDGNGRPTRMRITFFETDELPPPTPTPTPSSGAKGAASDAVPTPTPTPTQPTFNYVFSGFGEANVITVPIPTPTPTPTSTPLTSGNGWCCV